MTDEKIYDIPLRKFYTESASKKKVPHAVKGVREFIAKRTRSQNVLLSTDVNELLWSRGISHPPAKIRVKVRKDGEKVIAELISATPVAELKKEETSKEAVVDSPELKKQDEQKA
ncbi:MAG: 50S ribosomal protein L31e [Candidatus Aenigmarchaeota archaeon]|nr:50S ribosomal protein L31e [Candidatus Aenigmarchaeota archaeon]